MKIDKAAPLIPSLTSKSISNIKEGEAKPQLQNLPPLVGRCSDSARILEYFEEYRRQTN